MSIIHDALHKTQKTLEGDGQTAANTSIPIHKDKRKRYAVYALAICLGIAFSHIIFSILGHGKKPLALPPLKPAAQPPAPALPSASSAEVALPEKESIFSRKKPLDSLVLNGIFFSQDVGYALINNRILKKGDTIEDALITRIDSEEVEFDVKGKKLRLSTQTR